MELGISPPFLDVNAESELIHTQGKDVLIQLVIVELLIIIASKEFQDLLLGEDDLEEAIYFKCGAEGIQSSQDLGGYF